jgi:hypothetical protein
MAFDKVATRTNAKLRLALSGTAGAGKTHSSLLFAKAFGKKIGLMDSERGSSKKVVGLPGIPEFFTEYLEEKNIQEYLAKIAEAAEAQVDVLVIDSFSHSWLGALEAVDKMGGSKFTNGWKVISPLVTKLTDAILSYPGHVIATMRSKGEYVLDEVNGKKVPRKVGMATVAREGTDFEFDVMLEMSPDGSIQVTKTRCPALADHAFTRSDIPKIAATLAAWLDTGAQVSPADAFAEKIRFVQSQATLDAVVTEIRAAIAASAMTQEEAAPLKPTILAKKRELEGVES